MNNKPTKFADLPIQEDNKFYQFELQYRLVDDQPLEVILDSFGRKEIGNMVRKSDEKEVMVKIVEPWGDQAAIGFEKFAHIQNGRFVPKEYTLQLQASENNNLRVVKPLQWFENDDNNGYVIVMEHNNNYTNLFDFLSVCFNLPELHLRLIFGNIILGVQSCLDNAVALPEIKVKYTSLNDSWLSDFLIDPTSLHLKIFNFSQSTERSTVPDEQNCPIFKEMFDDIIAHKP